MHRSSANVFEVLRFVGAERAPVGVAEIARRLGLAVTTAHRALATLERAGYVTRLPNAKFEIGERAERLAWSAFAAFPIRDACLPYLRQLATASEETASLCIRIGWYALRLASVAGPMHTVSQARRLGLPALLHADPGLRVVTVALLPEAVGAYLAFVARRHPERVTEAEAALRRAPTQDLPVPGAELTAASGDAVETLSLPLRGWAGGGMAAIAIEGTSLGRIAAERPQRFTEWAAILARFEQVLLAHAEAHGHPYAHLPPDEIVFALPPAPASAQRSVDTRR